MAARRRGIRGKTMNGKAKQLEEDVDGVDLCGFFPQPPYRYSTNLFAEITEVLFLNPIPLIRH
jgi:hypothetical protein